DDRERVVRVRLLIARRGGEDPAEAGRRVLARRVLHREELEVVRLRVGDIDVADGTRRLPDRRRDAGATARTGSRRPVDSDAVTGARLPGGADAREVVREVERRAGVVRAVDDRDLRARDRDALVEL